MNSRTLLGTLAALLGIAAPRTSAKVPTLRMDAYEPRRSRRVRNHNRRFNAKAHTRNRNRIAAESRRINRVNQ